MAEVSLQIEFFGEVCFSQSPQQSPSSKAIEEQMFIWISSRRCPHTTTGKMVESPSRLSRKRRVANGCAGEGCRNYSDDANAGCGGV